MEEAAAMDELQGREDKRFRDRLISLLEWVAERDPIAAAKLLGQYTEELVDEMGREPEPCEGC